MAFFSKVKKLDSAGPARCSFNASASCDHVRLCVSSIVADRLQVQSRFAQITNRRRNRIDGDLAPDYRMGANSSRANFALWDSRNRPERVSTIRRRIFRPSFRYFLGAWRLQLQYPPSKERPYPLCDLLPFSQIAVS